MRKLLVAKLLILIPILSFGWWQEGHQTVAEIAYRHLTPGTKIQVDHLISVFETHDGSDHDLYYMAVWPDKLGHDGVRAFQTWHYIDRPFSADGTEPQAEIFHDNVVYEIKQSKSVLKHKLAPDYEKARFLSFLIHMVGDVHQPLHNTNRITHEHPKGDLGGNGFHLSYKGSHGGHIKNLHALWDSVVGEMDRYGYNPKVIVENATRLQKKYPLSQYKKQANDMVVEHWSDESFELSKNEVYNLEENATPSDDYILANRPKAEERIVLAGYRLANLLNEIFEPYP